MSLSLLVLLLNLQENKPQKSPALVFTKSHGNCFDYHGCQTLLSTTSSSMAHRWVQDRSQGELCCKDAHREMRKTSCCFPEPGSITWLPVALQTFCLFVITGCCQLKWRRGQEGGMGGQHNQREWVHVHPVFVRRHHAPAGLRKLLYGQSWVDHLSLVRRMSLPTPCSWWGGQGHLPGG